MLNKKAHGITASVSAFTSIVVRNFLRFGLANEKRKRFILCYLSFFVYRLYYSDIISVLVIVFECKDTFFFEIAPKNKTELYEFCLA